MFVAAHGYGRWEEFGSGSGVIIDPNDDQTVADAIAAGPNAQYLASLSESALNAYCKALDDLDPAGPDAWVSQPTALLGEEKGCRGGAERKFPNPALAEPLTSYSQQDLVGGMSEIGWRVNNDPRTLEPDREWDKCMAEHGYDVAEEHSIGDGGEWVTSGPIQAFYLAVMTGADGRVADRDQYLSTELPEDQRSLVQSEPEKAIALADFDCRERTD
ncbi:MAG: hypothetical protein LBK95_02070 [Bifidobacteriaceae bacterium]|jgi:hypothetical protein|nr:hypothetical protein [Bifidobacteriaceae bacterium]